MAALSIREEEDAMADSCCTLFDSCWLLEDSCFCAIMLLLLLLMVEASCFIMLLDSCFCESIVADSCFCESMVADFCFCEIMVADSCCWPMLANDTDSRDREDDLRWGENVRKSVLKHCERILSSGYNISGFSQY